MTYNSLGDRVNETINGVITNFTLDLNTGLTQVLADGTNTYLYGSGRIGQFTGADSAYFLGDALGSVRQLVDGNGAVTLSKGYEPYGEVMWSKGEAATRYGYTSEMQHGDLVFLRARYYQSYLNQFIQPDPIVPNYSDPQSLNLYSYVRNNPIHWT
jgi:RHS repeat-associated protein